MNTLLTQDMEFIIERTRPLWEEMRGERIFITGGTGFYGCWLLESLAWAYDHLGTGTKAVVLTRNPQAIRNKVSHLASHPAITFHRGDMCTFDPPEGAFSFVIHAATEPFDSVDPRKILRTIDLITKGTRRVFDIAINAGVKRMLFTSSGAVYGKQPLDLSHTPEEYAGAPDPLSPGSEYGETKRQVEMMCSIYARQTGLPIVISRGYAFSGPYLPLNQNLAFGNFIQNALDNSPIEIQGDGTPCRSYLYGADLAIWLWTMLLKGESCYPYNTGSDQVVSIRDLAEMVSVEFSPNLPVRVAQQRIPGILPARYVPSIQRAKETLGLDVWTNLSDAIRKTLAWKRRQ